MDDSRKHNYNGRSRHQSRDERESRMEMTKLMSNAERSEKSASKSALKATTEGISLSLHQCARNGDEHNMKILLRHQGSHIRRKINQLDDELLTPLHYAARYNHLNLVRILVDAGADVQALGKNGATPLHQAASFCNNKKIREVSSDEDVCDSLPPPPEVEFSEEEVESERLVESYRAWEDRMSVSLDQIDDSELPRQMGAGDLLTLPNHNEQDKGGSVICYLVTKGANINAVDIYNQTPLHFAARLGNEAVCKDLLYFRTRIKIEASDEHGNTPLHIAVIHRQIEVIRLLIEADANLLCQNKKLSIPLHYACIERNVDLVQILFEACIKNRKPWLMHEMVNTVDVMSNSPLHVAVEYGNFEVVKLLMEKHAEVNMPRDISMYPMHLAAQHLDTSITKLLLDNRADIESVNLNLATPLHIASTFNSVEVARLLIERGAGINLRDKNNHTPFLEATCYNNVDMVELLLEKGADFTATDRHDKTAIFLAAEKNNLEVLTKLLSYPQIKRLVNLSDHADNSPVHAAADYGHLKIVQCLHKNGADMSSKNEKEQTPLHLASKSGRIHIVQELIKLFPRIIHNEDVNSNTSLHLAAQHGNSQVVKVLLDGGADVFARNYDHHTPLDLAASNGWTKTCQALLKRHFCMNYTDKTRTTPLHLASHNGHAHVVELLLKSGFDVSLRDDDGKNCLDMAIDANQVSVAMVIVDSAVWRIALRNVTINPASKQLETPIRKLIRKMPDVALRVFDRCMIHKHEQNPDGPDYEITFDYEFLEDLYASWVRRGLKQCAGDRRSESVPTTGSICGDHVEDRLPLSAEPYSKDSNVLKENHPLFIMILSERGSLLEHPLVTTLLQHKWNTFGRFFYYLFFFIYIIFLIFLTAYMVTTDPPYLFGADSILIEDNQCANLTKPYEQSLCASIGTYVIIALAGFNLLKELFQIYQTKLKYFGWTNLIEWVVYVMSLLLVISFNECQRITGYRLVWQWNMGTLSVFLVWFNLVLFIRKFPKFGIYVVMFTDILRTFIQFFVVFFLFIFAYAIAFYATFQNKVAFGTIPDSIMKTYVMIIGEIGFDDIFHNADNSSVFYPEVSYILFIIFLTSMSIIVVNLLVGLAVSDVKTVQKQAALKRMAMQVELSLDVERILPDLIRRKAFCLKKTIFPNKCPKNLIWQYLSESYLSPKTFQKALDPKLDAMKVMKIGQDKLGADMKKFKKSIKGMKEHNKRLESMLMAVMAFQNVPWNEDDYIEDEDEEEGLSDVSEK